MTICERDKLILKATLKLAKEKIECYIETFGLKYPGGTPINTLLSEIDRALKL